MIIGLTGGLASGKTMAANFFAELGAAIIDADDISRQLTAANGAALPALQNLLGDSAFDKNGDLLRDIARQQIFNQPNLRQEIENILHPLIATKMRAQMAITNHSCVVLSIPLLFETQTFIADCHRIIVIDCEIETQIARATKRGLTAEQARQIIAAQIPRQQRLSKADNIIDNNGNIDELKQQVIHYYHIYTNSKETL